MLLLQSTSVFSLPFFPFQFLFLFLFLFPFPLAFAGVGLARLAWLRIYIGQFVADCLRDTRVTVVEQSVFCVLCSLSREHEAQSVIQQACSLARKRPALATRMQLNFLSLCLSVSLLEILAQQRQGRKRRHRAEALASRSAPASAQHKQTVQQQQQRATATTTHRRHIFFIFSRIQAEQEFSVLPCWSFTAPTCSCSEPHDATRANSEGPPQLRRGPAACLQ